MKRAAAVLISIVMLVVMLAGCGIFGKSKAKDKATGGNIYSDSDGQLYLNYDRISEFKDGIAVAEKSANFRVTNYVTDENFNVLFSYIGNERFIGKYIKLPDANDEKITNIINQNGDVVYSYDEREYKKSAELASNGLLIVTEQNDTYNSSKTVTGIYDIESKSYCLEPDEKYTEVIKATEKSMFFHRRETCFFHLIAAIGKNPNRNEKIQAVSLELPLPFFSYSQRLPSNTLAIAWQPNPPNPLA